MTTTAELFSQALVLDDAERAKLACGLLQSLNAPGAVDISAESGLAEELQRRLKRIDSGEADFIDGDEALDELTAAHERRVSESGR